MSLVDRSPDQIAVSQRKVRRLVTCILAIAVSATALFQISILLVDRANTAASALDSLYSSVALLMIFVLPALPYHLMWFDVTEPNQSVRKLELKRSLSIYGKITLPVMLTVFVFSYLDEMPGGAISGRNAHGLSMCLGLVVWFVGVKFAAKDTALWPSQKQLTSEALHPWNVIFGAALFPFGVSMLPLLAFYSLHLLAFMFSWI